jgi:hypothetical protein
MVRNNLEMKDKRNVKHLFMCCVFMQRIEEKIDESDENVSKMFRIKKQFAPL